MTKTYMSKLGLFFVLICLFFTKASAQYAIGGTAGVNLYNSVYWLTWDPTASGSTMISFPAGANAGNVINGTYIWQFSPTVRISAIITNEVFVGGVSPNMTAYTPGSYLGDGLDLIYSGNNQPKPGSRGVANSGLASPYGGQVTFNIDVKVAILINGVYTDVVYPGMVVADAESIDSGGEFISGDTPNPVAWQLINKRTEGNAADAHYKMDLGNGGKSFKIYVDLPPGNFGVQAVMFAHGARNIQNLSMKGSGLTAMAIGFVLPFDLGDAPLTYRVAGHYMDKFQITDYYPGDGTYAVVNYATTPLLAKSTVYIGADNVDPDGQPVGSALANNDDQVGNNDESTLNPAILPDIKVNQAGNVVLSIPVTNTKSVPATLYAWIDFNNDGVFTSDELVSVPIPANTANQTFTLTFLNATFANKLKVGTLYTRLRITTTPLIDDPTTPDVDERSFSFAADGEAEDYKLKDILGVNISGTVFDDHNGGTDGAISGTPIRAVSGQQLYAYLVDNTNVVINKAPVQADGTYSLTNSDNGTYTVAISTNNVPIGSSITGIPSNLPANWKPSGEAYGTNNAGHAGIESGPPNLKIQVSTPGTSLDITGVNFALNQIPTTVADIGITPIATAITIDAPANDADPDGTLDLTKVLLIDPADNGKKTVVTIAGQGTYTVNATTGKVTFTPVATFTGKTTILYTIKDDYASESLPALITINVKPVGVNDVDQTTVSTPVTTVVKTNDGNSAIGTTVTTGTAPIHGTIVINASGSITYTPTTGYIGTDTYTYILNTADGVASDPIIVTITIGASTKPTGVDDFDVTPINTAVTTTVVTNDPSASGSTVAVVTPPAHGTAVVANVITGTITYTPAFGFIGKDTYTYTLTNGGIVSDPIKVTISVKPVGTTDADVTPINTQVTTGVKANDGLSASGTNVAAATAPTHGTIVVDASGTITYTPTNGYTGTDSYTYTLTTADGVVSDPIKVNITIYTASMSLTKVANNGGAKVGDVINYTLTVTNTGTSVLSNIVVADVGADVGSITPANIASLVIGASTTVSAKHTLVAADVTAGLYSNQASATATDVKGNTVTKPKSDNPATPVADDPTVVLITPAGTLSLTKTGVFAGKQITYSFVVKNTGLVALSAVTINDDKVGLVNFVVTLPGGSLLAGANVTYSVVYTLTQADKDAGVVTNTATANAKDPSNNIITGVSAIATSVPKSPVAVDDAATVSVNGTVVIKILSNDSPGSSTLDPTTIAIMTQPAHGTVKVNGDGTVTYTPTPGYAGPDIFTYRVKDTFGYYTNIATVTLTDAFAFNITIPTEFTPNGDGVNDVFEIRHLDQYTQNQLSIVNRWGNEVFKQTNYQNTWTGDGLNEGTYYYLLKVKATGGSDWQVFKGYVTLIRTFKK